MLQLHKRSQESKQKPRRSRNQLRKSRNTDSGSGGALARSRESRLGGYSLGGYSLRGYSLGGCARATPRIRAQGERSLVPARAVWEATAWEATLWDATGGT